MKYYPIPFPFKDILAKKKRKTLGLEEAIRQNLQFLVFCRLGEFSYDRHLGFEIWEHDMNVFYREKEVYFEKDTDSDIKTMDSPHVNTFMNSKLKELVERYEPRLEDVETSFNFIQMKGRHAEYSREIKLQIDGRIKSTGHVLNPPFKMTLLFSPFRVKPN